MKIYIYIYYFIFLSFIIYNSVKVAFFIDFISKRIVWITILGTILSIVKSKELNSILWIVFIYVLITSFITTNFFLFYITFEMRLLPILIMIIYWGLQPERLSSGLYFLVYTRSVSIPFIVFLLKLIPWVNFILIEKYFFRFFILIVIILPFLVKIPVFILHFWLPKAHVEARTSGSMVLAGILLKLGSYGICRLIFLMKTNLISFYYCSVLIISSLISGVLTFSQSDVKKLVAFSRITHITFLTLGLISFNKNIIILTIIVSISHAWASIGIFAVAGILSHGSSSRLRFLLGTERKFHWVIIIFGILLLSNSSIPPLPSFFPEFFLTLTSLMSSYILLIFVLLRLSICYYNSYLFFWGAHFLNKQNLRGFVYFREAAVLAFIALITVVRLWWLNLF